MTFDRDYLVRFAHCDPAGIVFYPHYYVLFNDHVEDWFAQCLGTDFAALHHQRGLGVPTVRIETDFAAPSRLGEHLTFSLAISRIGRSSVQLSREVRAGKSDIRVRQSQTLVCMNMATEKAEPWPDDLRTAMTPFLVAQDAIGDN